MRLVAQWREIARGLAEDWGDARLRLTVADTRRADRAAALLGPITPARRAGQILFYTTRYGGGPRPDAIQRLLARLDAEEIDGTLELVSTQPADGRPPATKVRHEPVAEQWDKVVAGLPSDWTDAYAEIELRSSDHLERAALLLAPVNPSRFGPTAGFRFRVARRFGYGASPGMVRRCLERLDEESIRGTVRLLYALSDTRPVATQGPVWYQEGKVV